MNFPAPSLRGHGARDNCVLHFFPYGFSYNFPHQVWCGFCAHHLPTEEKGQTRNVVGIWVSPCLTFFLVFLLLHLLVYLNIFQCSIMISLLWQYLVIFSEVSWLVSCLLVLLCFCKMCFYVPQASVLAPQDLRTVTHLHWEPLLLLLASASVVLHRTSFGDSPRIRLLPMNFLSLFNLRMSWSVLY